MKKTITTVLVGLLLLLPLSFAQGNADDAQTGAEQTQDLTEICSQITKVVAEGDSFAFCKTPITIGALSSDSIAINGEEINFGDEKDFDGVKISYDQFEEDKAQILLTTKFEKKLLPFETARFKLFYGDDNAFAGAVDAKTESIAETVFGTNKATATIRSSTANDIAIGIDFENEDKSIIEKLHILYPLERMKIQNFDSERTLYYGVSESPQLFEIQSTAEDLAAGILKLKMGDAQYTLETTDFNGVTAIKISSEKEFTVYTISGPKQTKTVMITTKLAQLTAAEKACVHDIDGSSLDDFARKASVQGFYPAADTLFGVFTDYCKDEHTLINYGCVGLRSNWQDTSRVSFLEVMCPICSEGTCAGGPYCSETDKYADNPSTPEDESIYRNGKVIVFEEKTSPAQTETPQDYDEGVKIFTKKTFEDKCQNGKLAEYGCDLVQGYTENLIDCPEGKECQAGACQAPAGVAICGDGTCDPSEEPSATSPGCPADCAKETEETKEEEAAHRAEPTDDILSLRTELMTLENLITILETGESGLHTIPGQGSIVPEVPKEGVFDKFKGLFGFGPKLPEIQTGGIEIKIGNGIEVTPPGVGPQPKPTGQGIFGKIGGILGIVPDSPTELLNEGGTVTESIEKFGMQDTAMGLQDVGLSMEDTSAALSLANVQPTEVVSALRTSTSTTATQQDVQIAQGMIASGASAETVQTAFESAGMTSTAANQVVASVSMTGTVSGASLVGSKTGAAGIAKFGSPKTSTGPEGGGSI